MFLFLAEGGAKAAQASRSVDQTTGVPTSLNNEVRRCSKNWASPDRAVVAGGGQ